MILFLSNSKISKALSSIMVFVIIFNNMIFPTRAFALSGGPAQVEFASFDSAGSSEMVNLFTGDFAYNIPLLDIDGYPVNIAYHASPSMDQEASWVGLGWNINAGAINRGMRGLPDDFDGEPIRKEANIKDYEAYGVGIGYFGELIGAKINLGFSGGIGAFTSNYTGFGLELSSNISLSVGKNMQTSLTAGLGVKLNSQDGMGIYPSLGLSAQRSKGSKTASLGVNIGASINSRSGLQSISAGYSLSLSKSGGASGAGDKAVENKSAGLGTGKGFSTSTTIPASSQGTMPTALANMKSRAYNFDFKLGPNTCVYAQGGNVNGYYVVSGMQKGERDKEYGGYGYLYSQHANTTDLMDFSREKDGVMYPETPNLPIANYTYDIFSANAQGLNYAFRPQRNDIGVLHDNATNDNSFGLGIGAELLTSNDINLGINVSITYSEGHAGNWNDDNNDMRQHTSFTYSWLDPLAPVASTNYTYEPAYFKVAGEKTSDDATFLNIITNTVDDAYRVKINKKAGLTYFATGDFVNNSGGTSSMPISYNSVGTIIPSTKADRAKRNNLVSNLTAFEATNFGLHKTIQSYPEITSSKLTPANFDNLIMNTSIAGVEGLGEFNQGSVAPIQRNSSFNNQRKQQLSEMTLTQDNGSRYVYGIPLYTRDQQEAMFNIKDSGTDNYSADNNATISGRDLVDGLADGLATYNPGVDDSKNNKYGTDNFFERSTLPNYSNGFLLTDILSTDYVDRTGNGPSSDDYGDYTKFNYTNVAGVNDPYKWRMPMTKIAGQANFNQGLLADRRDNKGVYLYGKKDLWYTQSIETKNYVAFFVLNDQNTEARLDAIEAAGQSGGISSATNKSRYLKEIRLYAKKDLIHGGIANAKPIKVVNFEYDYSLCGGVPNNRGTAQVVNGVDLNANKGKLTLKRIYFTYGNSKKGKLSPYEFNYGDINHDGTVDADENPGYNQMAVDRWGVYKPNLGGSVNNLDFPYTNQTETNAKLNKYASAWSLTTVKTPAGSSINVYFEADDYAYIQNKEAGQMFNIAGFGSTNDYYTDPSPKFKLYGNNYLYVDLQAYGAGGATSDDDFKAKYLKDLTKIYFKVKVDLDGKQVNYEFVPGYADIEGAGVCPSGTYQIGGTGPNYYKYAYIKMTNLGIKDDNTSSLLVNPIVKASMQMGRMYLPQIVFPGSAPSAGTGSSIMGLVTTISDAIYIFDKGINQALYHREIAKTCDPSASVVRLYNPIGKKIGGGSRVSLITINDNWNSMSGESDSNYGQVYSYTKTENGREISSGVASYEPMQGADENSMRYPVDFAIAHTFAPNDQYFQEEPMGESFFPDPLVGYEKITVKNLPRPNVTTHATGRTEYEFFTARDFPVVTDRTDLQKQRVKPNILTSLLRFGSTDKLYLSQGYVIKTNDMHGKPKSQMMFAENSSAAISGMTYHYKSKQGLKSIELDNKVDVLDPKTNTIAQKEIGKVTDFYTDARSAENETYNLGISLNISSATCTYYVPLVFVWPSFSYDERRFKSHESTKLIQQYGLIDYVEAFENNSKVRTENLIYDDVSGEVVMTKTINDFDAPIYNLKYGAHWGYEDMGAAFQNAGISFPDNVVNSAGKLNTNTYPYFRPGDEVAITNNSASTDINKYIKAWVIDDKQGATGLWLVDIDGKTPTDLSTFNTSGAGNTIKILRSGRRNLQSLPMASMLSKANPRVGNSIVASLATQVINSSAVEYSDKWNLVCGDKKANNDCVCTTDTSYINMTNAIKSAINNLHLNFPSATLPMQVFQNNAGSQSFADINQEPFIRTFSWFNSCYNYLGSGNNYINLNVSKSISGSNHKISFIYNSIGNDCSNNSSCPIELNIVNSQVSPNIWDGVTSIFNFGIVSSNTSCLSSNTFTFNYTSTSGAKTDGVTILPQGTGTSCNQLLTCTQNNLAIQCGKYVGDVINPYVENIRGNWRVKKSYSYLTDRAQANTGALSMNGDVRGDGTYTTFLPFYRYTALSSKWDPIYTYNSSSSNPFDKWIKNNEVDKINEYGNVLQARDVLNRPSASLYGYNHTLPVAAANNAYYNQLAFDGFEDYAYIKNECSGSLQGTTPSTNPSGYIEHFNYYSYKTQLTTDQSHTGRYSIAVPANSALTVSRKLTNPTFVGGLDDNLYHIKDWDNAGLFGPYYSLTPQKFVISAWAKESIFTNFNNTTPTLSYSHVGLSVVLNGSNLTASPKTSAIINGWQKLEYEFTVPATAVPSTGFVSIAVSLLNNGTNDVFYDDIRIHPFNSSMKSMVYDPQTLRLMAELDDRNYATFYEYDEEGTLVRVKKETEKGIYTIKESRSGLKK